jgi:site-specific DNA-adenine methylase
MTSYHGGKQRIGSEIAQIIYDLSTQIEDQTGIQFKGYTEPFCGMLGVYQHIIPLFEEHRPRLKYQAGDINESVIQMWNAVKEGWEPPTRCSRKRFYELKGNGESSPEKGFIGHACAFRSIYFATYKPGINLKYSSDRLVQMSNDIQPIQFKSGEYPQFSKLKGWIIYCDPPYFTSSKYIDEYHHYRTFNYEHFYNWVEQMAKHNLVFISERSKLPYTRVGKFQDGEKLYLV